MLLFMLFIAGLTSIVLIIRAVYVVQYEFWFGVLELLVASASLIIVMFLSNQVQL